MVGIAVVGAGYWGPNLIRNFAAVSELVGVVDRDKERLQKQRLLYPGLLFTAEMEEILTSEAVQGVALATPADSHYALAKQVIEAGKSVFVEKPLAVTVADCHKIVEAAKRSGKKVMVKESLEAVIDAVVEYRRSILHPSFSSNQETK